MPKNILLLMCDQFVYNAMGFLDPHIQTPHLDWLAQRSTHFSHCYSNAPLCLPARAALATGLYPQHLNAMDNYSGGLTTESKTWMQTIQSAGYQTAMFGKVHLHRFPQDMRDLQSQTQGYGYHIVDELPGPRTYGTKGSSYYDYLVQHNLLDTYRADMKRRYVSGHVYDATPTPLDTCHYADVYIANRSLDFLSTVDVPWFCTVGFGGPHDPWDTPKEYVTPYQNTPMPAPRSTPVSLNPQRPQGVFDNLLSGQYDSSLNQDICNMTPQDIQALRRSYYGHITLIDQQIGRILDCLKARGQLDNTIIAFCADHGEQNGDYGLLFKQTFLETSLRVPLLICVPGQTPQTIDQPVELMDMGVTLCHLLGLPHDLGYARSLVPTLTSTAAVRETVVAQLFDETMVLSQNIKAVFNAAGVIYQLFNLSQDPLETTNLAAADGYQALEAQMHQYFAQWKAQTNLPCTSCT